MSRLPKKRPPSHPGEMLWEEFLLPLAITQAEFAHHLGWATTKLNQIIRSKRAVTSETALALEDALGMPASFWLNLQQAWDLWHAMQSHTQVKRHPKAKAS